MNKYTTEIIPVSSLDLDAMTVDEKIEHAKSWRLAADVPATMVRLPPINLVSFRFYYSDGAAKPPNALRCVVACPDGTGFDVQADSAIEAALTAIYFQTVAAASK